MRRVGVLMRFSEGDKPAQSNVAAMRQKLAALGWVENRSIQIIVRWGGGDAQLTRTLAKELIGMSPSVIVTNKPSLPAAAWTKLENVGIQFRSLRHSAELRCNTNVFALMRERRNGATAHRQAEH